MRLRALVLLGLVPLCHLLYHAFDGWAANWCQWVAEHGWGVVASLLLLETARKWTGWARVVGVGACLWMIAEDAQCVVCGSMRWGDALSGPNRLCVDALGDEPYKAVMCAALAYLAVKWRATWTRRAAAR